MTTVLNFVSNILFYIKLDWGKMDAVCRLGKAAETRDLLGRQLIQMETLQVNIIIIIVILMIINLYCHKSNLISIRIDYIDGKFIFSFQLFWLSGWFGPLSIFHRLFWLSGQKNSGCDIERKKDSAWRRFLFNSRALKIMNEYGMKCIYRPKW